MDDTRTSVTYDSTFHTVASQPEIIGKYEIIAEVGRGSMGKVYQAFDSFGGREVAIKVAHPQYVRQD